MLHTSEAGYYNCYLLLAALVVLPARLIRCDITVDDLALLCREEDQGLEETYIRGFDPLPCDYGVGIWIGICRQ